MVRKPTGPPVIANPTGNNPILPQEPFRLAAFGDSLMWGEGLSRGETFAALIATALAKHHQRKVQMVVNRSRCGAQIKARPDRETRRDPAAVFIDRFPDLFPDKDARDAFANGDDQAAATKLNGEIPSTFPTVEWQVDIVDNNLGSKIDVVLLTGGANDIRFDVVLNPQMFSGKFIEEFDADIEQIAHDDFLALIKQVRMKCPRAVIMVFGYFSPISHGSHVSRIRDFFKHEADDSFGWQLNRAFNFVDVEAKIREARVRSLWAQGRAQHWMRTAVNDANLDQSVCGPGVLFIPSGMSSAQAAFADNTAIHSDFTHPTKDPAQKKREEECPRIKELPDMQKAFTGLMGSDIPNVAVLKQLLTALAKKGPLSVVDDLNAFLNGQTPIANLKDSIATEAGLIQRALIASFLHPNSKGAAQYADIAMRRYREHLKRAEKIRKAERPGGPRPAPLQPGGEPLNAMLKRFNLRSSGSLLADVGHLDVDSLSLHITTARDSDKNLAPNLVLVVDVRMADGSTEEKRYQLNFKNHFVPIPPLGEVVAKKVKKIYPHLEPNGADHFTVDTANGLRLESILDMKLELVPDADGANPVTDDGQTWRPLRLDLEINGVEVFQRNYEGKAVPSKGKLALDYPPPPTTVQQPEVLD